MLMKRSASGRPHAKVSAKPPGSKKILIIGGVAAGATAAARARRLDEHTQIVVLEAGPYVSFANCGLPYYIGREIERREELILLQPEDFAARYAVEVHTHTAAVTIDRASRTVKARRTHPTLQVAEEISYSYDRLILAQGGRPVLPPLPGADLPHVFPLWTIPEMDAVESCIASSQTRNAVVLGGGFIGLEMAEALRRRGLRTSVVEMAPHVMPLLDDEVAAVLEQELRRNGVAVHSGRRALEIRAEAVLLDDGELIPADLVILAVGVAPAVGLAREAGLEIGKTGALAVNEYLQTSDPLIYAAGDMIEVRHRVSGQTVRLPLAGPANRQGRVAGTNAVAAEDAGRVAYRGVFGTSVIKLFSLEAGSTGLSRRQAEAAGISAQSVTIHKPHHAAYYPGARDLTLKLVYEMPTGRVLGAQAVGAGVDKRIDVISTALAGGLTVDDAAELDLAYAPPFSSANDPVNVAAFVAQNRLRNTAKAVTADEVTGAAIADGTLILDVRTPEEFEAAAVEGAINIEIDALRERLAELDPARPLLVHCAAGYRAHLATRILVQHGFRDVTNILGGFTSIERQAEAGVLDGLELNSNSAPVPGPCMSGPPPAGAGNSSPISSENGDGPYLVDVRSPEEYAAGHVPGAINLPVGEVMSRHQELAAVRAAGRKVVLYCASGSRSEYARLILNQLGVSGIENGGGYQEMMRRYS